MDELGYYKIRNIVETQVELAIQRGEIDPTHLNDLLMLDVKKTIADIFKRKRVQVLNGKRKAAPTTEPIAPMALIETTQPTKHARENDDDQVLADFIDGYEADDLDEYDFSDFVNLWTEDNNLKADAKEEELYNAIYNGANILAATV